MKKRNWWNRYFYSDVLKEQEMKYRKFKRMVVEFPELDVKIINAKTLMEIFHAHKAAWDIGFRNKNLAPCEWGMFRTENISTMKPEEVYIGGIYGLNTHNIPKWDQIGKDEPMGPNGFGLPKDEKIYDLIVDHYRTVLRTNILAIRSDILTYIDEYEFCNDQDEYAVL
jgi:hypothetical protein